MRVSSDGSRRELAVAVDAPVLLFRVGVVDVGDAALAEDTRSCCVATIRAALSSSLASMTSGCEINGSMTLGGIGGIAVSFLSE